MLPVDLLFQFPTSKIRSSSHFDGEEAEEGDEEGFISPIQSYHITKLSTPSSVVVQQPVYSNSQRRKSSASDLDKLDRFADEEEEDSDDLTIISDSENGSVQDFYTNKVPQYTPVFKPNGYRYKTVEKPTKTAMSTSTSPTPISNNSSPPASWTAAEITLLMNAVKYCTDNDIMTWKNVMIIMIRNAEEGWKEKTQDQACNKFWKIRAKAEAENPGSVLGSDGFEVPDESTTQPKRRSVLPPPSSISSSPPASTSLPLSSTETLTKGRTRTIPRTWTVEEVKKLRSIIHYHDKNGIYRTWDIVSKKLGGGRNGGMCCTKWNALQREKNKAIADGTWDSEIENVSDYESGNEEVGEEEVEEEVAIANGIAPTWSPPAPSPVTTQTELASDPNHPSASRGRGRPPKTVASKSRINRRWTEEEISKLTRLVHEADKRGEGRNWKKIGEQLESNRTATQACDKWRGMTNKSLGKGRGSSTIAGEGESRRGSTSSGGGIRRRRRIRNVETSDDTEGEEEDEEEEDDDDEELDELESDYESLPPTSPQAHESVRLPAIFPSSVAPRSPAAPFYYNPNPSPLLLASSSPPPSSPPPVIAGRRKRRASDLYDEEEYRRSLKR